MHSVRSARVLPDGIPFELRMLEVLLEQTVQYLEDKSNKIKMLSRAIQDVRPPTPRYLAPRLVPVHVDVAAPTHDYRSCKHAQRHVGLCIHAGATGICCARCG